MRWCVLFSFLALAPALHAQDNAAASDITDLTWHDAARNRDVPVRIYSPKSTSGPVPVLFFSHGLGGSREMYAYLGKYWSTHGYISVHVQHPGSDSNLLKTARPVEAAKKAMVDPQNLINRPKDISFAIDQVTALNSAAGKWQGSFDLNRIGVAGHSFGAYTTMAIAGETLRSLSLADPRVKAVIPMSTPAVGVVGQGNVSYANVRIPALHFTGTEDKAAIIGTDSAEKRREAFDGSPGPDTYLVIFKGGDHAVFSGRRPGRRENAEKDPLFEQLVCEGSTAFWNAYLKGDAAAKKWLKDGGFAQALGANGTLEQK